MLGRKSYTRGEIEHGKVAVEEQLAGFRKLQSVASGFEAMFFNSMALVLDPYYVHRLRVSTGKDGNALNELELIADSLLNNGGVLRGNNVVKYVPEQSVVKLKVSDKIHLTADEFERLSAAFFGELERKFLTSAGR
ncbi:MAG TPA: hypothetical protein VGL99_13105 [Chloroflexota bacterium]|jgi:hypothetical protein